MKLNEISSKTHKNINKLMESRFGFAIDFDRLTVEKAQRMLGVISENLHKIRHSSLIHTAERNPRYMELIAINENINSWLANQARILTEGEVGTAEVLLAAKDMVDSVQGMIEKVGKMQNEQMPQLLDSVRDQIGQSEADQFKASVGEALMALMTQLNDTRAQVDNGVRALSGEQIANPMDLGQDANMPGDEFAPDEDEEAAGFGGEAPVEAPLGRELR